MRNNSFVDSWVAVMLGGGRSTTIVENRFEKITHTCIEYDNRGMRGKGGTLCKPPDGGFYKELEYLKVGQPPWSTKYPELPKIATDYPCVPCYNNMSANSYCDVGGWITANNQQPVSAAQFKAWHSTAERNHECDAAQ